MIDTLIRRLKPTVNKVSSLRDLWDNMIDTLIRRLKPTVNKVPSLRDLWDNMIDTLIRRLKPTVNKVSSLRDFVFDQLYFIFSTPQNNISPKKKKFFVRFFVKNH